MNTKNQFDFKTKSIGGWSGYVAAYMGQGSVTPREHVAFLLMWLESSFSVDPVVALQPIGSLQPRLWNQKENFP
jgi:hypothetical protein